MKIQAHLLCTFQVRQSRLVVCGVIYMHLNRTNLYCSGIYIFSPSKPGVARFSLPGSRIIVGRKFSTRNSISFEIQLKNNNKMPTGLNGHLSIRDSSLTSCRKCSYRYISTVHHRINKNQQWHRKAAYQSLNSTIAINMLYINRDEDDAYSLF